MNSYAFFELLKRRNYLAGVVAVAGVAGAAGVAAAKALTETAKKPAISAEIILFISLPFIKFLGWSKHTQ